MKFTRLTLAGAAIAVMLAADKQHVAMDRGPDLVPGVAATPVNIQEGVLLRVPIHINREML